MVQISPIYYIKWALLILNLAPLYPDDSFCKTKYRNSFAEELLNDCRDSKEYASACPSLAKNGECTKSSDFMKEFCKRSCDKCLSKNQKLGLLMISIFCFQYVF